jgi:hypothetical protein
VCRPGLLDLLLLLLLLAVLLRLLVSLLLAFCLREPRGLLAAAGYAWLLL